MIKTNLQFLFSRFSFYTIWGSGIYQYETKDDYSLGLHLVHEHHVVDREDFNKYFRVQILENFRPSALEKKEHLYIHKYKTLYPVGLNKNNPFGLSILS